MADASRFLTTHSPHQTALQLSTLLLNTTWAYTCISSHRPFETAENLLFDDAILSRPAAGTATVSPLFPTAEYTQIRLTTSMDLYRRVSAGEPEEHARHAQSVVLRVDTESVISLWVDKPRGQLEQDEDAKRARPDGRWIDPLRCLGEFSHRVSPVQSHGAKAWQRAVLSLERVYGADKSDRVSGCSSSSSEETDPLFPWDICQFQFYIGPGVSAAIAGKKPGFEIAWVERTAGRQLVNGKWRTVALFENSRIEQYVPGDKATRERWEERDGGEEGEDGKLGR